jgi:cell division protein FtsQ
MRPGDAVRTGRASRLWSTPAIFAAVSLILIFVVFLTDQVLRPGYFTIESIHIEGSQYRVDPRTIERTAWRNVHGNYFSVNLNAIEEQLKEIPGVYAVAVRRVWPGELRISITESEGLAKWSELRSDASPIAEQFVNLPPGRVVSQIPELSGPAKQRQVVFNTYLEADQMLWPLGLEITTVNLTRAGDWKFRIRSSQFDASKSFLLIVGRQDPVVKVSDFAQVFEVALASQADSIAAIDLRYPSGLAVRWKSSKSGT